MCTICEKIKTNEILFEKGQYVIYADNDSVVCALKKHSIDPEGCKNCIKGYMDQSLHAIAGKHYGHHKFYIQADNVEGHFKQYTDLWPIMKDK